MGFFDIFTKQKGPQSDTTVSFTNTVMPATSGLEDDTPQQPVASIEECKQEIAAAVHNSTTFNLLEGTLKKLALNCKITKKKYESEDKYAIQDTIKLLQTPETIFSKLRRFFTRQQPPIRPIDVFMFEVNLGQGGRPAPEESYDLIKRTLKANPNAIIILITSDKETAAPVLEKFKEQHVYYASNNTGDPFNTFTTQEDLHLNDACIRSNNLQNMIKEITERPKYQRLVPSISSIASGSSASSHTPTSNPNPLVSTHSPNVASTASENSPRHDDFILDSPNSTASSTIQGSPNRPSNKSKLSRSLRVQVAPIDQSIIGASIDSTTMPHIPSNNLGSLTSSLSPNNHQPKKK